MRKKLEQLEGWDVIEWCLRNLFWIWNFKEAFSVMTRIAFECEAQGLIQIGLMYTILYIYRLNTHDAKG